MRHIVGVAAVGLALALAVSPARAALGPVVASYGKWDVRHATDLMTDRITCLATYRGNNSIQLARDTLYLRFDHAPRAYRYRIDDQPVSPMIASSRATSRARIIALAGAAFGQIVKARRLRLEIVTLHDAAQFDIDLDGIAAAYSAVYYCRQERDRG